MGNRVRVTVESVNKKVFVSALDWPGWSRSGKTEDLAVEAFLAAAPRYAAVAREAGLDFDADDIEVDAAEREAGDASTAFGVPGAIGDEDRRPVGVAEAKRLAAIVEGAWAVFDRISAAAPEELRKGPHGGGRDRTKIVGHVNESDGGYATVMGIKEPDVAARRAAMLDVLRQPSDGSGIAGRKWPPRYAARRIAWHALDHAWEIEDRTEPT
jgi:hypothetical protein